MTLVTPLVDHIEEKTAGHGVNIDGVTLKDGGALEILGDTNYFSVTNGTAALQVGPGGVVDCINAITLSGPLTISSETVGFSATGGGTTSKTLTVDETATLSNKMNKTGENLAIGSDADGDMYYRASSVLARLAKGAANLKMFMNAGATAPEWASGSKLITFTRDLAAATGNVAYTGVGFKPSVVIMFATVGGTAITSWGFQVGTTRYVLYRYNATLDYMSVSFLVAAIVNEYTDYAVGNINTYDSDGFTMTWTKEAGSPTGTLTCLCLCLR